MLTVSHASGFFPSLGLGDLTRWQTQHGSYQAVGAGLHLWDWLFGVLSLFGHGLTISPRKCFGNGGKP